MSNTQFLILCLILLSGFALLDQSGCGCLVLSAVVVVGAAIGIWAVV